MTAAIIAAVLGILTLSNFLTTAKLVRLERTNELLANLICAHTNTERIEMTQPTSSTYKPENVNILQRDLPSSDIHETITHIQIGDQYFLITETTQYKGETDCIGTDITRATTTNQHATRVNPEFGIGLIVATVEGRNYAQCVEALCWALNQNTLPAIQDQPLPELDKQPPAPQEQPEEDEKEITNPIPLADDTNGDPK